jgi:hypothetical protein
MIKQTERTTAIIVTFPVQFLIDIGKPICEGKLSIDKDTAKKYGIPRIRFTKKGIIAAGYKEFIKQIEFVNSDPEDYWSHIMGNVPTIKESITHCYINILSKIRYRAKVIEFQCAPKGEVITKKFGDGRKMSGKNWVLLHQFERIKEIKMGGFQGFRYWKENYHDTH